ncbi:unnamed protein product [Eruca vesicaria subsp. sativa]|uniref:Uncharacterized protein n=1 Tax=Eruca vesicaria subsp. sativa TaxID=29727 RepID=A0ABC8KYQ9_ERUVS|nr:unnamed protein product [Eruca vesicaria subsp. sativa]
MQHNLPIGEWRFIENFTVSKAGGSTFACGARNVPGGLSDQKNYLGFGGGYSGIGDNGLPFGGVGGGVSGPSGNLGFGGLGGVGGGSTGGVHFP